MFIFRIFLHTTFIAINSKQASQYSDHVRGWTTKESGFDFRPAQGRILFSIASGPSLATTHPFI
jgi:hypothetical protein